MFDSMTSEEIARYLKRRAELMAKAGPWERFRLWCNPYAEGLFITGWVLGFASLGCLFLPGWCLMSLAHWTRDNESRHFWSFVVSSALTILFVLGGTAFLIWANYFHPIG